MPASFYAFLTRRCLLTAVLASANAIAMAPRPAPPMETGSDQDRVAYRPSAADFPNPERGFYHQVDCNTWPLRPALLRSYREVHKDSLIMCAFSLEDALDAPISQKKLDLFSQQMDLVRAAGSKVILRFVYNYSDNARDAPKPRIFQHMEQLQPYLERHSDVIAAVQAGFIGSWGEWGNSTHYGSDKLTTENWSDRKDILYKLLEVLPENRMVQVRTPEFKYRIAGQRDAALQETGRLQGSGARIGHHNDCFLATPDDAGTFKLLSPASRSYLQEDTAAVPMGGETCRYNPPRSDCITAIDEMARFHWSYLNADFHEGVLASWKSQGCHPQVRQRLGYRFAMLNAVFQRTGSPGSMLRLFITLENTGWAAPFNPRAAELVLRPASGGQEHRIPLNVDLRSWLPGRRLVLRQDASLPADMAPGEYAMLLHFPDPMPSLRSRPEYAIRLANEDTWEAHTGYNRLGYSVKIVSAPARH
ncbi:DUF4832 domain-containing protein [Noviherbaspirillum soli]|uniref:DUF4832 domain-containing protein n=1 Tax=Noviherbaspirillum soli TaxID=1064518 RepID=UPI00188A46D7|nr:DUF4832 domain-containing protein [Noviherbaspirillum soli]